MTQSAFEGLDTYTTELSTPVRKSTIKIGLRNTAIVVLPAVIGAALTTAWALRFPADLPAAVAGAVILAAVLAVVTGAYLPQVVLDDDDHHDG